MNLGKENKGLMTKKAITSSVLLSTEHLNQVFIESFSPGLESQPTERCLEEPAAEDDPEAADVPVSTPVDVGADDRRHLRQ